MRIPCPFCGERGLAEFTYLGDAAPQRPKEPRRLAADAGQGTALTRDFIDYAYLRDNPSGMLREWWQHTGGCRAWLTVERNVSTHALSTVTAARESLK